MSSGRGYPKTLLGGVGGLAVQGEGPPSAIGSKVEFHVTVTKTCHEIKDKCNSENYFLTVHILP